jgi:hypothetical protein
MRNAKQKVRACCKHSSFSQCMDIALPGQSVREKMREREREKEGGRERGRERETVRKRGAG